MEQQTNTQQTELEVQQCETTQVKGFGYGLLLIFFMVLITVPFGIVGGLIKDAGLVSHSWISLINYVLSTGLTFYIATRMWNSKKIECNKVPIVVYFILPFLIIPLGFLIEPIANVIPMPESIEQMFEKAFSLDLAGVLTAVVAAPVFEELICRGVILKNFLNKYTPQKAIVFSALIFGIMHLNPWQFIGAFFIGLLMGWVYYKTRSIFTTIFIHVINNGFAYLMAFQYNDINIEIKDIVGGTTNYIILLVISAIVLGVSYILINKVFNKNRIN